MVTSIKSASDFEKVVKGAGRFAVAIYFHDNKLVAQDDWDIMKNEFLCMQLYKVDCNTSPDIVEQYGNKGPKPYFKFYHYGKEKEEVAHMDEWWEQSMYVREALEKYDNVFGNIASKDGSVYQLKDLDEFSIAMMSAK